MDSISLACAVAVDHRSRHDADGDGVPMLQSNLQGLEGHVRLANVPTDTASILFYSA